MPRETEGANTMSDVKRRDFLKRTAATLSGAAVGIGVPVAIVMPNASRICPVNTYLKGSVPQSALALPWTAEAQERLARVPAGFMRDIARTQSARLAHERGELEVSLTSVEGAIARATSWMNHATGSA